MQAVQVVLKFGGSSVAEVGHWQTIVDQVQHHLNNGRRPLLVLSALKNVSNLLEALLHQALAGVYPIAIAHLKELHLGFASQLGLDLNNQLSPWFERLEVDCLAIYQAQHISPKLHAKVLAIGELLSTTIGSAFLSRRGFDVLWQDAREILKSNDQQDQWHHYTSAVCDYRHDAQISAQLNTKMEGQQSIIVTQGFIASDLANDTVLLGREGSDTSAAYLAAILKAEQLEIWTDVTGVFSANPREISGVRQLPKLSYQQALLMAQFGAKVLHQRVMQPMEENQIPVTVRCTGQPDHSGTLISSQSMPEISVKAIVFETNTTQLIAPAPLPKSRLNEIAEQLSSQGFDLILICQIENQNHLILNYANSDKVQPSETELIKIFVDDNLNVNINCALITLVGEASNQQWIEKTIEWINLSAPESLLAIYHSENKDRLSLLVSSENHLQISQQLHVELIG
jgi:diaminopimelate decarboxylase/aspartate kinase